jgi:prolyl 4-hydroxylase
MATPSGKVKKSVNPNTVYFYGLVVLSAGLLVAAIVLGLQAGGMLVPRKKTLSNSISGGPAPKSISLAATVVPKTRVPDAALPAGVTRERVTDSPILDILHGFLTPLEAQHLIDIAQGRFAPSVVALDPSKGHGDGNVKSPVDRTSYTVFLEPAEDAIVAAVEARAAQAVGVPVSHFERLQVVRYQPGQYYKAHHDYLPPSSRDVRERGQRTVTLFVYLNDLAPEETGGGTRFPHLEHTIRPSQGSAALWHNVTPDFKVDERTLHSGEPVRLCEKYGLNIWARSIPQ